jgi:hypothetical protein
VKETRKIIKDFISERWSDEKVVQVFAFNEDGKMHFINSCSCLTGVHSSEVLHTHCLSPYHRRNHWELARRDPQVVMAESAYLWLMCGRPPAPRPSWKCLFSATARAAYRAALRDYKRILGENSDTTRQRILGEILREIMTEREAMRPLRAGCAGVELTAR